MRRAWNQSDLAREDAEESACLQLPSLLSWHRGPADLPLVQPGAPVDRMLRRPARLAAIDTRASYIYIYILGGLQ